MNAASFRSRSALEIISLWRHWFFDRRELDRQRELKLYVVEESINEIQNESGSYYTRQIQVFVFFSGRQGTRLISRLMCVDP